MRSLCPDEAARGTRLTPPGDPVARRAATAALASAANGAPTRTARPWARVPGRRPRPDDGPPPGDRPSPGATPRAPRSPARAAPATAATDPRPTAAGTATARTARSPSTGPGI